MTISKGKTGPKSATQGKNEEVKTEISNKNDKKKEEEDGEEEKKSNGVETKSPGDTKKNVESNNSKSRSGSDHRVPERKGRWHNTEEDMPVRRIMIGKIVSLLKEKKPDADESWKKKLPDMARRLEDSLYRGAPDKATYSDQTTSSDIEGSSYSQTDYPYMCVGAYSTSSASFATSSKSSPIFSLAAFMVLNLLCTL